MTEQMKECYWCHRVGYRGFVPFGDHGWACKVEVACHRREQKREFWRDRRISR